MKALRSVSFAILAALHSVPGLAQEVDGDGIYQACLQQFCQRAIRQSLRELRQDRREGAEVDDSLTIIAFSVLEAARELETQRSYRMLASTLNALSVLSEDEAQMAAFRRVARAIRRGELAILDQDDPFSASPS